MKRLTLERAMWVVWPGFLTAIAAEIVLFTIFDPLESRLRLRCSMLFETARLFEATVAE